MGRRVAVIGGGVAGLAAAVRLRDASPADTEIVLYEQSGALGGKLRTGELAGTTVERGAESFLVGGPSGGRSAAVRFAHRVGLGEALVHPTTGQAAIAVDGTLTPMPAGTLLGVPADPADVAALARVTADADRDEGRPLLAAGADVAVGALVRSRLGDAVVDRLVDPLLGGVYAGRADTLSLAVTIPALAAAARREHTLLGAVRAARAAVVRVPGRPVFATVAGGMSRLVGAAAVASGARISLGLPVRELARDGDGWRLVLGAAPAPIVDVVDAVVLAVPARAAARLLDGVDPTAATAVRTLDYASVALVAMALPPGTGLPPLSGLLVPAGEGTLVKAATFFTTKWGHLARPDGPVIVRASVGRAGEEHRLQAPDGMLIATAHAELTALLGASLPTPSASWVQRWGGGLPQYGPGHLDRVAAARAALADRPSLALAGAAYDGVGIPACVLSGEAAADNVLTSLEGVIMTDQSNAARVRELNATIRYTMWSVFRASSPLPAKRDDVSAEVDALFEQLGAKDVVVRGTYDVAGLRADADLMIWWHSESPDALQEAYALLRLTELGRHLTPVWSQMALHRPAEFNKSHLPAFLAGEPARPYICVYPFVRSYEWYLLPDAERRAMLAEHGQLARGYPDVRANTVASFALGDYEWMLAFEADELHRIVDLMRDLRASGARRHVRDEVPFYTGRRRTVTELVAALP